MTLQHAPLSKTWWRPVAGTQFGSYGQTRFTWYTGRDGEPFKLNFQSVIGSFVWMTSRKMTFPNKTPLIPPPPEDAQSLIERMQRVEMFRGSQEGWILTFWGEIFSYLLIALCVHLCGNIRVCVWLYLDMSTCLHRQSPSVLPWKWQSQIVSLY